MLDGLNVSQPANGQLLLHVSTDAFRSIRVEPSRYSAEFGKGSGGVILLETGIGDDHYRFIATDFIPSWQNKNGWKFDQFNPRLTLSGPVVKGKIWFFDALDGAYQNVIVTELPVDQNEDVVTRLGNLAKVQANVTPRNILTTSFNVSNFTTSMPGSGKGPQVSTPAVDQPAARSGSKTSTTSPEAPSLRPPSGSIAATSARSHATSIPIHVAEPLVATTTSPSRADRWRVVSTSTCVRAYGMAAMTWSASISTASLRRQLPRAPISYLRRRDSPNHGQLRYRNRASFQPALPLLALLGLPWCPRTHPAQHRTQRIRSGSLAPH